ncbi:AAA family ATPase [Saccharopolyspora thermophila]|uniref:AAA domain-containing protein n=1 Tax=Saccharopolyspora thermophila TaxID=89367 RepID=A0ABP3NCK7_9PSEU
MSTPHPSHPDNVRPLRQAVDPFATAWTADALMAAEFPEPRWAVPGILAEGVNVLAGPPKVGKSWMSLGLALAVAAGGRALEMVDVEPGPVLYLALEDTPRRLQTRMGKLLGGAPAPPDLTLATTCPTLPAGGDEAIAGWLERNPDARMVVLDVFAKIRGVPPAGMSAYDADYAAVSRAKRIADQYGVAMVLVHHVRKMGSDDFLTEVSGTNGIAGAADAVLVLKRGRNQADGILNVTGRDVDEAEYALAFHAGSGTWQLLDGPASDHTLHDTRATILRFVRENPGNGPTAIAEGTGLNLASVKQTCRRMAEDGQLRVAPGGKYSPGDDRSAQAVSPLSPSHQITLDQPE